MAATTLAATSNTPVFELQSAPTERILVIEHDGALRKILRRLFSSEGYEVDVVPDRVAGLEMLRRRSPSAVIVDLPRPGSSECDLCKKIADWIPGLPLVILSGSGCCGQGPSAGNGRRRLRDHTLQPTGTRCAFACVNQACVALQSGGRRRICLLCLCGCDGGLFQDGDHSWGREDHGYPKGI